MLPVTVHLTPEQLTALKAAAARERTPVTVVVRRAVDDWLARTQPEGRMQRLRSGRGLWKGRDDLGALRAGEP
jgi:hypothetical protein